MITEEEEEYILHPVYKKIYRLFYMSHFKITPIFNYAPTLYNRLNRRYIYDAKESPYGLTLSVPYDKKVKINGKWRIFGQLPFGQQCKFYIDFLEANKLTYIVTFEKHHPEEPEEHKVRMHAHILVYFASSEFLDYIEQQYCEYCKFDTISQLQGIYFYEPISTEKSFIRWINYMYKEHDEHHVLMSEEHEHILEIYNSEKAKEKREILFKIDKNPLLDC